jgi:CDP-diacylglycerol--serine O-phosphatidyltransferase
MAFGYYAISQSMQGSVVEPSHFDSAARAIGFAIVFDMFDGRIARMTQTTSDFGRELDSLADVITFGVAPAVLAWMWGFRLLPALPEADLRMRLVQLGAIATFLFMIAGASRLARFNIQVNPQPSNPGRPGKKYFVGMPIPAAAGVVAAIVHFARGEPLTIWWWSVVWLGLLISCAFLMVSTWRFYSFKDVNLRGRHPFRNVVFIGALIAGIWYFSHSVLFFIALTYMLSGVLARVPYVLRRRTTPPPPPAYQGASGLE